MDIRQKTYSFEVPNFFYLRSALQSKILFSFHKYLALCRTYLWNENLVEKQCLFHHQCTANMNTECRKNFWGQRLMRFREVESVLCQWLHPCRHVVIIQLFWVNLRNSFAAAESQNHLSWKKPLRSLSLAFDWSPPCQINQSTQCHMQMFLECFQGWWLHLSPRLSIPMFNNPLHKEIPPDVQTETFLVQIEAVSSCLIAGCLGEEVKSHLAAFSCQGFVQSQKFPREPPFLQAESPQLPQLLLVVQTLHWLHSLLWASSSPSLSFLPWGPRTGHSARGAASPVSHAKGDALHQQAKIHNSEYSNNHL